MKNKIIIIDTNSSNQFNLLNALNYLGYSAIISKDKKKILESDKIIFPGIGSFYHVCKNMKKINLFNFIKKILKNKDSLSICVGMQLFFNSSEEGKFIKGFNYINKKIIKFDDRETQIPNISWLSLNKTKQDKIYKDITKKDKFYFVHSYIAKYNNFSLSYSNYDGQKFTSLMKIGKAYGCQFHPEVSGESGLKFLNNFCK
jgi:imidazole glycerol-phosphate synthase subunit HisH|tara:strand:- start:1801 stop:2403 length:603 start_codon:yes stop_codon:yes gene_type:complete